MYLQQLSSDNFSTKCFLPNVNYIRLTNSDEDSEYSYDLDDDGEPEIPESNHFMMLFSPSISEFILPGNLNKAQKYKLCKR